MRIRKQGENQQEKAETVRVKGSREAARTSKGVVATGKENDKAFLLPKKNEHRKKTRSHHHKSSSSSLLLSPVFLPFHQSCWSHISMQFLRLVLSTDLGQTDKREPTVLVRRHSKINSRVVRKTGQGLTMMIPSILSPIERIVLVC